MVFGTKKIRFQFELIKKSEKRLFSKIKNYMLADFYIFVGQRNEKGKTEYNGYVL